MTWVISGLHFCFLAIGFRACNASTDAFVRFLSISASSRKDLGYEVCASTFGPSPS